MRTGPALAGNRGPLAERLRPSCAAGGRDADRGNLQGS